MNNGEIAVGVDGSDHSRAALAWAVDEATRRRSMLRVIHSATPPALLGPIDAARFPTMDTAVAGEQIVEAEAAYVKSVAPDLRLTTLVRKTSPALALLEASEEAELVVVGSRGRSAAVSLALGSVSLHVAAHAASPVAVVRGPADVETAGRPVVVGVDGSEPSQVAVGFAFEEAAIRRTSVLAVHTWDDLAAAMCGMGTDYFDDMSARGERELSEALSPWREKYPEILAKTWVRPGHPVSTLVTASHGAQLVVVGSRGRGEFLGMLLGSVGAALIRDAHCPVVISR